MYIIKDNVIKLTRGDTLKLDIKLFDMNGDPVELGEDDELAFTIKRKINDETPVLQKRGEYIVIEHDDTKDLYFGGYFYDVQATFANGEVYTIIAPEQGVVSPEPNFVLTAEVNFE